MTREMIITELQNRGYEVSKSDIVKNGVLFQGIMVGNGNVRPTIYVDTYLDRNDLDTVVDEIEDIYDTALTDSPTFDTSELMNWNYVKTRLQLCLQKKGDEDIVKRDFLDLEQYVRVIVNNDSENGTASYKVNPEHLEKFGVDEDTLFHTAWDCTKPTFIVEDMLSLMAEMMHMNIEELKEMQGDAPSQIVLSNKGKLHGAVAMCDTELLSSIADKYETDLAILPSSIHECIVLPVDKDTNFIELNLMVCDVNKTQVAPEEVLSNHAYKFNRDEKRITYYISPFGKIN